jgi:hypothetical protein
MPQNAPGTMAFVPAAVAEPGDPTVRAPDEVGAMHLTVLVGREDRMVAVERQREGYFLARRQQPTGGGGDLNCGAVVA